MFGEFGDYGLGSLLVVFGVVMLIGIFVALASRR